MQLLSNSKALVPGNTTSFQGQGGGEPYAYSVLAGGAGGTINPTTGIYTAPALVNEDPKKAYDTIQCADDLGNVANARVLIGTPLSLLCDIIQTEMDLDDTQVWLWDQKRKIPNDSKLYVTIGVLTAKPFGNSIRYEDAGDAGLNSFQYTNFQATVSIDIQSRGTAARDRKEEVIMALQSVYAQQQQESNGFQLPRVSSTFVNLSEIDGAAIPYRFNISINMLYAVRKTKAVPYFDTFDEPTVLVEP